ncbi:MAG TPA: DUF5522 domain-containing protein [Pedobacter sp.]|jgi:hypothetical protein
MIEGTDYYLNEDGFMVFTETYHKKRGYCCRNKCRHCPWEYGKVKSDRPEGNKDQDKK